MRMAILVLELNFALDAFAVDKCAISAFQITDVSFSVFDVKSTVLFAYHRRAWAEMAFGIPANKKTGNTDRNKLSLSLPLGKYK
ncbi:MAG: hypothetical protein KatS3mg105_4430 [Gemmatales bacterium]|nr:MAG: hypothetical protein KatS3mg105_4430 [Gemmatales bacterium]